MASLSGKDSKPVRWEEDRWYRICLIDPSAVSAPSKLNDKIGIPLFYLANGTNGCQCVIGSVCVVGQSCCVASVGRSLANTRSAYEAYRALQQVKEPSHSDPMRVKVRQTLVAHIALVATQNFEEDLKSESILEHQQDP